MGSLGHATCLQQESYVPKRNYVFLFQEKFSLRRKAISELCIEVIFKYTDFKKYNVRES